MGTWEKYKEYYEGHKSQIRVKRRRVRNVEKISRMKMYFKNLMGS